MDFSLRQKIYSGVGNSLGLGSAISSISKNFNPVSFAQSGINQIEDLGNGVINNANNVASTVTKTLPKLPNKILENSLGNSLGDLKLGSLKKPDFTKSNGSSGGSDQDYRVRLKPFAAAASYIYGNGPMLDPVKSTNGLMFPYTPTISHTQSVEYNTTTLTHTNQTNYSYTNTPSPQIQISGKFTCQTQQEGQYSAACLIFLSVVTKMEFGTKTDLAGLPPPVLQLSGYGSLMYNELPVIITSYSFDLPDNVDFVEITLSGFKVFLPVIFSINISLSPTNAPIRWLREWNLADYKNGKIFNKNPYGGWS